MSPFATRSCRSTCQQHVPLSTSAQDSPRRAGRVTVACCHRPERGRSCRARGSFRYLWPAGLCSSSRFETWDVLPFVVGEKDRLQVLGKPLPVLIWDLSNHNIYMYIYDAFLLFFLSSDFTSDFGAVMEAAQDLDCEVPAWTLMLRNVVWFSPSANRPVKLSGLGGRRTTVTRVQGIWVRYIISCEYLPKHLQIKEISGFSSIFEGSVAFKIPRWTFLHCPSIPGAVKINDLLQRSCPTCHAVHGRQDEGTGSHNLAEKEHN